VESSAIVAVSGTNPQYEVNDRYKKCGIICADAKCRYIPTRSEIRELKSQGVRGGGHCYACKGDVIVDDGR
jgi:hypothetical protein